MTGFWFRYRLVTRGVAPLADVYDKFLEQETARLLEEEAAKGDEELRGDPVR